MFFIQIAGLIVGIDNRYPYVETLCRDFIVRKPDVPAFCVSVPEEEILACMARSRELGRRLYPLWYYENICIQRTVCRRMLSFGCLFLHSCVMSIDGDGYGLAAPVQGGKTTQLRLWQKRFGSRLRVINGDKPFYRLLDGQIVAYGSPWMGKEAAGYNGSVPVKALFFLEKGRENRVRRMDAREILSEIFYHTELPETDDETEGMAGVIASLIRIVPCFHLVCDRTVQAVDTALAAIDDEFLRKGKA